MSTSSTIARQPVPPLPTTIISVADPRQKTGLERPVSRDRLMPAILKWRCIQQRRDAAQSGADTFGIRHVVGSIDELVAIQTSTSSSCLTTGPRKREAVTRSDSLLGKTV